MSSSPLQNILEVFNENGIKRPDSKTIQEIHSIDQAMTGRREELEKTLQLMEDEHRENWQLGTHESWNHYEGRYEDPYLAVFPHHDERGFIYLESLTEIHRRRYKAVFDIFSDQPEILVEDGGLKSFKRAKDKLEARRAQGRQDHCPDLTRLRLIVPSLSALEEVYGKLTQERPLHLIGNFNHYKPSNNRKYSTPFRGVLTTWGDAEDYGPQIATEVQLVTQRVRATMDLDHPFNVSQVLKYPNQEVKDYVHSLMLKASILDFKECFQVKYGYK